MALLCSKEHRILYRAFSPIGESNIGAPKQGGEIRELQYLVNEAPKNDSTDNTRTRKGRPVTTTTTTTTLSTSTVGIKVTINANTAVINTEPKTNPKEASHKQVTMYAI